MLERLELVLRDTYAGVSMMKFPEDLRVYEKLLWDSRAEVVVEIGSWAGGSALWFRDRLRVQRSYLGGAPPRVITIDRDTTMARKGLEGAAPDYAEAITLVEGDVTDPAVGAAVRAMVPAGTRCFVIEDSAHVYDTTRAALDQFSMLVQPGGYLVVEDTVVDIEAVRLTPDWPRGVIPAVDDFLSSTEGAGFRRMRNLESYGVTCHPRGFLQRVS